MLTIPIFYFPIILMWAPPGTERCGLSEPFMSAWMCISTEYWLRSQGGYICINLDRDVEHVCLQAQHVQASDGERQIMQLNWYRISMKTWRKPEAKFAGHVPTCIAWKRTLMELSIAGQKWEALERDSHMHFAYLQANNTQHSLCD